MQCLVGSETEFVRNNVRSLYSNRLAGDQLSTYKFHSHVKRLPVAQQSGCNAVRQNLCSGLTQNLCALIEKVHGRLGHYLHMCHCSLLLSVQISAIIDNS